MLARLFFTRNTTWAPLVRGSRPGVSFFANTSLGRVPRFVHSPLRSMATTASKAKLSTPKITEIIASKKVGWWLVGTLTLVFSIVVIGGLTRLTELGLSITEWKPVTGSIPPLLEADWEEEFAKYQDLPEFKQLNSHITLEEFKFIYSMEWGHRLLGRAIGLFFVLPAIYFWRTKQFGPHVGKRVLGLTALLGLQGFIGWWMVQLGLDEEQLKERRLMPTVSQYRLTTHLGAAFLMYLGVLWTAFEVLNENKWLDQARKGNQAPLEKLFSQLNSPVLRPVRKWAGALLALTFVTAMSGGMVAGLDAGLIYNTFPHMGEDWLPPKSEFMSPVFAHKEDKLDMWWRNLTENPTTVQLIHRIFAITTFCAVTATWWYVGRHKNIIPKPAQKANNVVMGLASLQVTLGICTLIYLVPIPLALAHQAGALALLTGVLAYAAALKKPRPAAVQVINQQMKQALLKQQKLV